MQNIGKYFYMIEKFSFLLMCDIVHLRNKESQDF